MMELISLKIKIVPEIYPTVIQNLNAIVAPTLVQPGCLECAVLQEAEDQTSILFIERWNDEEQMLKHLHSEDFKVILAMMELSEINPEFSIQAISGIRDIEDLTKILN